MTEHVVAFDPGGRSGYASARMSKDRFEYTDGGVLRQDFMGRWFAEQQGIGRQDEDVTEPWWPRFGVMVYESWYPRPDENGSMEWIKGDPLLSAQHIGQLRLIADLSGTKIVTQHPSDKPQAVKTMPQRLAVLNRDSNEQHDQDARMHLWLYFWRNWFTASVDPEDTVIV